VANYLETVNAARQSAGLPALGAVIPAIGMSASSGVQAGPSATVERRSAGSDGTMYNWTPKRLNEARLTRTREKTVERALDLDANDAHVSGLIESMNINVVGVGYRGQSKIVADQVPMTRLEIGLTQRQLEWEWKLFCRQCDIQGRKEFVDVLSVADRSMLVRGEYLVLPRMVKNTGRYSLKLQVVDPLRLKTPSDKMRSDRIIDGVAIDGVGRPEGYWVHANPRRPHALTSDNFIYLPAMRGHRQNVLHGFIEKDPDQYRGEVFFAPAMKFFRDLSDLLDSEVVSNIFTSAVALFIATADPTAAAKAAAGNNYGKEAGRPDIQGYDPGAVLYGRPGEKPEILEHNRPGVNFVPFVDTVLRAACTCAGIPLEIGLKRYGDMSYSSARAAILDAWRVFGYRQDWLQRQLCRPVWSMVVEEAWLRDYVELPDFYDYREAYCESKWIAPARGQLDQVKETQSNILKLKYNMISHTDIASGEGLDWEEDVAERRASEMEIATMYGLEYPDTAKKGVAKENAK
jgi:lambda family phage portal protein